MLYIYRFRKTYYPDRNHSQERKEFSPATLQSSFVRFRLPTPLTFDNPSYDSAPADGIDIAAQLQDFLNQLCIKNAYFHDVK